jgi:hypothetical protein
MLSANHLDIADATDRDRAAHLIAERRMIGHAVANIYVLGAHPDVEVVRAVNLLKGRPADQVGAVTTTRELVPQLFDWSALPDGIDRPTLLGLMDALWTLGPFGFRGPAAAHVPDHLSSRHGEVRTVQLVLPGERCPSNLFVARTLQLTGLEYLFGTSANRSHRVTGMPDEPPHYLSDALAAEFSTVPGFTLLRHADDMATAKRYPLHRRMSTTVLSFHQLAPQDAGSSRPRLVVDRHGSLPLDVLRLVLQSFSLDFVLGPKASQRLAERNYPSPLPRAA